MSEHTSTTGNRRFDRSFIVRMIRDFFFVLLALVAIELGIRFGVVVYDYHSKQEELTEQAAQQLAADIKSIMLNSGGPVASRTVYPILRRNYQKRGLEVAVEPARVTVTSIEDNFGFTPRGIPVEWPQGRNIEKTEELRAEEFCVTCHSHAKVGDVLGRVTVRNYFAEHLAQWWHEVRLSALLGMGNVLMHTIILFSLLRLRMEPLLALKAVISRLSKSGTDLSHRAEVRSDDEFGALADDLNHLLDRVCYIIEDISASLEKIDSTYVRLNQVGRQMAQSIADVSEQLRRGTRQVAGIRGDTARLERDGVEELSAALTAVLDLVAAAEVAPAVKTQVRIVVDDFRKAAVLATELVALRDHLLETFADVAAGIGRFSYFLEAMAVLEERMHGIAGSGRALIQRLTRQERD